MRFLTFPVVFKWSKWGGYKKLLYVHFEGLTTNSYFGKWRPLGRHHIEKKAFLTTLLMRKHDFCPFQWFLNGQKCGVIKKLHSMSILKVWQLTLILVDRSPPGALYARAITWETYRNCHILSCTPSWSLIQLCGMDSIYIE